MRVMIQLLNLKIVFIGLATDDANIHIMNIAGILNLYNQPRVSQKALRLKLFPFSLTGEITL